MVIGQTAGMVGHDIRNPLQAITSDMYLIQEEINRNPNYPNEDIRESIESINENISYINKIVSDLQDYTRTLTLSKVPVKIIGVFRTAITNVPESIKTQLNVDPNLTITSDPTYLQRILNNLVTNAVQAMPKGGSLILEAKAAGDKVQITITDTGIGIPEDAKPNLFKPLFTTKAKGQGLGLAVVKRLVETMGGTISFESHVEEGTKFTLELPRNQ
jgi:signal transduction histidine kinase